MAWSKSANLQTNANATYRDPIDQRRGLNRSVQTTGTWAAIFGPLSCKPSNPCPEGLNRTRCASRSDSRASAGDAGTFRSVISMMLGTVLGFARLAFNKRLQIRFRKSLILHRRFAARNCGQQTNDC